jgi:hypothetical protein
VSPCSFGLAKLTFIICGLSHAIPEIDEEAADEMIAEDRRYIKEALKFTIAPVRTADEAARPVGFGATDPDFKALNLSTLVDWRLQHQTRHAATGVRTKFDREEQLPEKNEVSLRRQLIRRFHEVLKKSKVAVCVLVLTVTNIGVLLHLVEGMLI